MSEKVYTIEEIKQMIEQLIKNMPVYSVTLFGSYAKNNATATSDVDILIDSDGEIRGLKFYALIDMIKEKLNKEVDVIEKSEIDEGSRIEKEIQDTGVVIYEKQR